MLKEQLSARVALNTFLIRDSEQSLKFARQKLHEFGDKLGKYLANLVKKRADSQNTVWITDSNGVYKEFSCILLDPLLSMLNYSFENGILPQCLREANICLILKKGKSSVGCTSCRPIALLNSDQKLLS